MQLKSNSIRVALTAATCSLLGLNNAKAESDWEVGASLLLYSEANDRVSAIEPVLSAKKEIADEEFVDIKLTFDSLTGASPNGATPTNRVQTFTRPSGKGSYEVKAGETPLDDTFRDTRASIALSWDKPLSRLVRRTYGVGLSREYDYTSLGFNATLSRDIYNRNATLQAGFSVAADFIHPEGDIPEGFSSMRIAGEGDTDERESTENKNTLDLLFGATQVIGHDTIGQVNYTFSNSTGYHSDPFKLISRIDGFSGDTLGYLHENRPDSRTKHGLYTEVKHFLGRDLINASYRFYTDDWGVQSNTVELRYRWNVKKSFYLQPKLRWYQQSAADFYTHSLVDSESLPKNATTDPRLAEFTAITYGLKFGYRLQNGSELTVRGEYYQQSGNDHPSDAIGLQKNQDLFPETESLFLQIGYDFSW